MSHELPGVRPESLHHHLGDEFTWLNVGSDACECEDAHRAASQDSPRHAIGVARNEPQVIQHFRRIHLLLNIAWQFTVGAMSTVTHSRVSQYHHAVKRWVPLAGAGLHGPLSRVPESTTHPLPRVVLTFMSQRKWVSAADHRCCQTASAIFMDRIRWFCNEFLVNRCQCLSIIQPWQLEQAPQNIQRETRCPRSSSSLPLFSNQTAERI